MRLPLFEKEQNSKRIDHHALQWANPQVRDLQCRNSRRRLSSYLIGKEWFNQYSKNQYSHIETRHSARKLEIRETHHGLLGFIILQSLFCEYTEDQCQGGQKVRERPTPSSLSLSA